MKLESAGGRRRGYKQGARAEAAEATGRRILDAFLARLLEAWFDEITLDQVAGAAGVTVQTVVRRFGGKDGLLSGAVEILAAQINERRVAPSGDLDGLVENLIEDYEQTGDAVIRLLALEPRHAALGPVLERGRSEHRNWASNAFAKPLGTLDDAARKRALDALVIITDVYTWKLLRRDMARTVAETRAALKGLIQAAIVGIAHFQSSGDER